MRELLPEVLAKAVIYNPAQGWIKHNNEWERKKIRGLMCSEKLRTNTIFIWKYWIDLNLSIHNNISWTENIDHWNLWNNFHNQCSDGREAIAKEFFYEKVSLGGRGLPNVCQIWLSYFKIFGAIFFGYVCNFFAIFWAIFRFFWMGVLGSGGVTL